jgi:hypothetical protein
MQVPESITKRQVVSYLWSTARSPNTNKGGTHMPASSCAVAPAGKDTRCASTLGASSSGRTSTFARLQAAHLALASLLLVMEPRSEDDIGPSCSALFWTSSQLARFFCRVRRACCFFVGSTRRTAEVWRDAQSDDDVRVAAVKTHCLFGSSGALFLTRTCVLKAEPEEDVGEDCEEVTNNEQGQDAEDINDGQGRAVQGRAI